jgi:ribosomal protein S27E
VVVRMDTGVLLLVLGPAIKSASCGLPLLCSTTVFSHSQTVVLCGGCSAVLCTPTGGKARLTEGAQGGKVKISLL